MKATYGRKGCSHSWCKAVVYYGREAKVMKNLKQLGTSQESGEHTPWLRPHGAFKQSGILANTSRQSSQACPEAHLPGRRLQGLSN